MIVCLGEALVDLICERPVASFTEAGSFTPHFGGALANVAVASSRAGADTALAGGAGDDEWGRWLRERLEAEGVGTFVAALAERGWDPARAGDALGPALDAAAEACTRWSALD